MQNEQVTEHVRVSQDIIRLATERNAKAIATTPGRLPALQTAALIFDPAQTYGGALARVLGAPNGALPVTSDDLADAIRLTALKIKSGDISFLRETLVGQAAVIEAMMMDAARSYNETKHYSAARAFMREFLALQKAHLRTVLAVASIH